MNTNDTRLPLYWMGTEVKFRIDAACPGFDPQRDPFHIDITNRANQRTRTYDKEHLGRDTHGRHYLTFDTYLFGPGVLEARLTMHIPDEDFNDGFRTVIDRQPLCQILR